MNDAPELIQAIAETAPVVAASQEELDAATDTERNAEAAVLTRAIELARPALRALSRRIVRDISDMTGRRTYHERRGLMLVDESSNTGTHIYSLYLLSDGTLATAASWSERAMEPVTVTEAVREYDLERCLTALRDALVRQQEEGDEQATAARERRERATRLSALVTLAR